MAEYIDRNLIEWYGCNFEEPSCENRECSGCSHAECSHSQVMQIQTADVIERSKIDKAIEEIKELYTEWENSTDDARSESNPFGAVLNIIQRNIGEWIMKYTIELTSKQKNQMDFLMELAHRYIGFNPKFEDIYTTNIEDTKEYRIGYKTGYSIAQTNAQATKEEWGKAEYKRGLEDARQTMLELLDIPSGEYGKMFGNNDYYYAQIILEHFSIEEIKDRIKAYEEKNAEINDHHFIVDSLRNLIDDYGVQKIVKALPEFGIIAESEVDNEIN